MNRLSLSLSLSTLGLLAGCLAPEARESSEAGIHDFCIPGDPDWGCADGQQCVPDVCLMHCGVDDPWCCPNVGSCQPSERECAPVLCALWCPNGFAKDENGCDTCRCEDEAPTCDELGGGCYVSPFDPGFSADCEGELDMDTADGSCPAFNQSCCVAREPEPVRHCGGIMGLTCPEGEYCSYAADQMCGAADQLGVCAPRPDACIQLYDPVCGCDGHTYGNACNAASAGVSVAHDGECAEPTDCRDDGCGRGRECSYCWGTWQCIPRGAMC